MDLPYAGYCRVHDRGYYSFNLPRRPLYRTRNLVYFLGGVGVGCGLSAICEAMGLWAAIARML